MRKRFIVFIRFIRFHKGAMNQRMVKELRHRTCILKGGNISLQGGENWFLGGKKILNSSYVSSADVHTVYKHIYSISMVLNFHGDG